MKLFCHVSYYCRFADIRVRAKGVEWLSELNDDDICDILPQLVQVNKFENLSNVCTVHVHVVLK